MESARITIWLIAGSACAAVLCVAAGLAAGAWQYHAAASARTHRALLHEAAHLTFREADTFLYALGRQIMARPPVTVDEAARLAKRVARNDEALILLDAEGRPLDEDSPLLGAIPLERIQAQLNDAAFRERNFFEIHTLDPADRPHGAEAAAVRFRRYVRHEFVAGYGATLESAAMRAGAVTAILPRDALRIGLPPLVGFLTGVLCLAGGLALARRRLLAPLNALEHALDAESGPSSMETAGANGLAARVRGAHLALKDKLEREQNANAALHAELEEARAALEAERRAGEQALDSERRARANAARRDALARIRGGLVARVATPIDAARQLIEEWRASNSQTAIRLEALTEQLDEARAALDGIAGTPPAIGPLSRIRLTPWLEEVLAGIQGLNGVALRPQLDTGDAEIAADPAWLGAGVRALIENAAAAASANGAAGQVMVHAVIEEDAAEIRIVDNGPGIAPEDRGLVYDPLFSTREGRLGLGLQLAQQVISGHGGALQLLSESGKGAAAVVRLPLADTPKADPAPEALAEENRGPGHEDESEAR